MISFKYELQAMKQLEINKAVAVLGRAIWLWLLISVIAVPTWAQNRQNPSSQVPPAPAPGPTATGPAGNILVDPNEDYRLAAGDTIDVFVEDATELSQTYRIVAAGTFDMPFLGLIKAQGKTAQEL